MEHNCNDENCTHESHEEMVEEEAQFEELVENNAVVLDALIDLLIEKIILHLVDQLKKSVTFKELVKSDKLQYFRV